MKLFVVFVALFALVFAATKDELVKDAERLKKLANDEIKKLEAEGKSTDQLKVLVKDIVVVEKQLESLQSTTDTGNVLLYAVETVLKGLESKLDAELKKQNGTFYDNVEEALIGNASRLKELAQTEITTLKSEGKSLLAEEVEVIQNEIIKIEKLAEAFCPSNEAGKIGVQALNSVLKGLETKLKTVLKKPNGN